MLSGPFNKYLFDNFMALGARLYSFVRGMSGAQVSRTPTASVLESTVLGAGKYKPPALETTLQRRLPRPIKLPCGASGPSPELPSRGPGGRGGM